MNILLVDDHISFCDGLIAAMSIHKPEWNIRASPGSRQLLETLSQVEPPDLIITDIMMPELSGIGLIDALNQMNHPTPIIVMSSIEDPAMIREVLRLGAIGYLPKAYGVHDIIAGIEDCQAGNIHVPKQIQEALDKAKTGTFVFQGKEVTKRQMDILRLMEQGLGNEEIAATLFISRATVKTHINKLFKTFGASNRINCLQAARNAGIDLS